MNRQIRRLAAGLLVCYLALFVQLNRLQVFDKQTIDADPRNNRQTIRDFNRNRGPIVTADGQVVAFSEPTTDPDATFEYQRRYPLGDLFSHVTGYYSFGFGSTQLEKTQNDVLMGDTAAQQLGAVGDLFRDDVTGSVLLTLRADVQQVAADALGGLEGSVVVVEPSTGKVLAMVSSPRYDPNEVVVPDTQRAEDVLTFYNALPGNPLLANAYQERYQPGSSFKVITTGIALENGVTTIDRRFDNETEFVPPQTIDPIQNAGGRACGGSMVEVFYRSCNIPFARMALELGPDRMLDGVRTWGVGEPVPIDLPRPASSTFCGSDTDCSETNYADQLPVLAINGFGQANDQLVPLHMAMVAACVANDGLMMKPYVVDATLANDGDVLSRTTPSVWKQPLSPGNADVLTTLMIGTVNQGTGRPMQLAPGPDGEPVQAAAKTGTSQQATEGAQQSNLWIIAFAPAEQPRYAIAVMVKGQPGDENSTSSGGKVAGPIAKQVLDYLIANDV
jgi:peptidoglycan glycosyltransferase